MGVIPVEETHDPRPTGKLIALRWKHEHLRVILLGAILVFAITIMFMSLLQKAASKNITIIDNGVSSVLVTQTSNVTGFLEEQGIHVGPYDRLSMLPSDSLDEGSRIVIDRAVGVTVKADGKQAVTYTTEHTVGGVISSLKLSLSGDDRISPALNSPLKEGMTVEVVRVRKEVTETKYPIAFTVVQQKSKDLESGKQKVVTTGKNGLVVFKTERVFENGKLVSQEMVEKTVAQPAVQQVVAIGTKKKPEIVTLSYKGPPSSAEAKVVKLNGQSVKVKRMLNNVTLTAYSAGFASTGKSKGDSGFGVTSSGATVREGRTIAVDPRVIPIGWWVYIEGIGFRRAEDTGSAVKGKKIDVYYDSEKHANNFGLKRGYTVYVIGPVKPSAD
ncbi:3D domain-containing protein [Cohnella silvisoli]|uniref:3D domain-containing protein n=1 Tax=Cohnella silvisoli TaxID=2873699 RepID=A0ABV1L3Q0_9BACL|nr:3D domain-containing protein [Cohnella silvisoli]MCD9026256.1 ubiquitin-like domain-containing protein [Cohnella silvisoli]